MRPTSVVLLVCIAMACPPARADSAGETRLREALRSTTSQLRSLEDERAKWQVKEGELQKDLEVLRKQLATRPAAAKGGDRKVAELDRRLAEQTEATSALKTANGKLTESLAQCENTARDASDTARSKEDERIQLAKQVSSLTERLSAAGTKNARMYNIGKELVDWVSNINVESAVEPLVGVKRVELENAAQDYEDKLLEQKVKP